MAPVAWIYFTSKNSNKVLFFINLKNMNKIMYYFLKKKKILFDRNCTMFLEVPV